jgi:hypothetical protein
MYNSEYPSYIPFLQKRRYMIDKENDEKALFTRMKTLVEKEVEELPRNSSRRGFLQSVVAALTLPALAISVTSNVLACELGCGDPFCQDGLGCGGNICGQCENYCLSSGLTCSGVCEDLCLWSCQAFCMASCQNECTASCQVDCLSCIESQCFDCEGNCLQLVLSCTVQDIICGGQCQTIDLLGCNPWGCLVFQTAIKPDGVL